MVAENLLMICHYLVLKTTEAEEECTHKEFSNFEIT